MKKFALLLLFACGGGSAKPAAPPAPPAAWKDMDHDQRMVFMKDVVMPKAKAIFVAFDPTFSTMDCVTCHGDGVEAGTYEMPNPKIKPLPNTEEAFMAWVSKDPAAGKFAQFMATEVNPLMAGLLGKKAFDPQTHTGDFSCEACHKLVDAKAE
jgi:hypothetical protein